MNGMRAVMTAVLVGVLGGCAPSDTAKQEAASGTTPQGVAAKETPQIGHGDSIKPPQPARDPEDIWSQIQAAQSRLNTTIRAGRLTETPALVADVRALAAAMARASGDTTKVAPQLAEVRRITSDLLRASAREDVHGAQRLNAELKDHLKALYDLTVAQRPRT